MENGKPALEGDHLIGNRDRVRAAGEKEHGRIQRALIRYLGRYREAGLEVWPEQRLQITPSHYRVVDVCVTEGEPKEQIFTIAPLVCVEILSRKDSLNEVPEIVDDATTGFIVDDLDAAVNAIERIRGLDRVICRRVFEERFSARRMASDYVNIYRQVIQQNAPSPTINVDDGFAFVA